MTATNVSKSTVIENIYKNFYTLLAAITNFSTIVYPVFPDVEKDATSDYPIVILNSPEISWNPVTFGKGILDGTITIDIYQTTAKLADEYASDVSDKIETSKFTLAGVGLRLVNLDSTNSDMANQGKIKVFLKSLIFKYKFYFTKNKGF